MFSSPEAARHAYEDAEKSPGIRAAFDVAKAGVEQFGSSALAHATYSHALRNVGENEVALAELATALRLDPTLPEALAEAVSSYVAAADFDRARQFIPSRIEDVQNVDLVKSVLGFHCVCGDIAASVDWANHLLNRWPDDEDTYLAIFIWSSLPATMIDKARYTLVERFPNTLSTFFAEGVSSMRVGRLAEAEQAFGLLLKGRPQSATGLSLLATCLMRQSRLEEAEKAAREALALDRRASSALNVLAEIAQKRGDRDGAIELDRRAEEASPLTRSFNVVTRANQLIATGKCNEAVAELLPFRDTKFIALRRTVLSVLANCYLHLGSEMGLAATVTALDDLKVDNPLATVARARLAEMQGDGGRSLTILEDAFAKRASNGSIACAFLETLRRQRWRSRADAVASEIAGADPEGASDFAQMYACLKNHRYLAEADTLARAARKKFPEYPGWVLLDATRQFDSGNYEEAERIASGIRGSFEAAGKRLAAQARARQLKWRSFRWLFRRGK